ncbi:MAG: 30S ribosomal protein S16 [Bacteroidales bacterium]|jgi:small subunit ribosomal protein S16|nr:30S ribosomal protein S16 [Bacteroidales bacterium]MDD2771167.1 30S ribosomal protein S16 [Bacteroidales bacterium]MDD3104858.1 30S ribosomal protein S16 [Bacteroidales bacterium]MDD3549475.1 30S ribosomal protein S16 [Bacteroidales bacterium]MDD4064503.1 30S ribosomal protein S16 [Bacteroidales bacterium]
MAVKIRLARHGKKNHAYFHIVVADSRAPRDGRLIETLGTYNPNTDPATITLDQERALYWINTGAQPTLTARRLLSYRGVLLKKHLQEGVAKGALTQEQADAKWETWMQEKESKVNAKKGKLEQETREEMKKRLEAEAKVNKERAAALLAKREEVAARLAAAAAQAAAKAEETIAEIEGTTVPETEEEDNAATE